jgi:AcrR family transcriptional regulator
MGRPKRISNEDLLDVAREVFVQEGIGASTRVIAKRAGISEAAIYQRFPTKAELFFAAMTPPALDVDNLLSVPPAQASALEHLERIALEMLAYFRELVPILVPLMSHPSFDFEEFASRHPSMPVSRLRIELRDHLATLRDAGTIGGDPSAAALSLFSSLFSLAFFERLGAHGGEFDPRIVRQMVGTVWHGLAPH